MKIRWRNLFVVPRAIVVRTNEHGSVVRVEGLVCDAICERRTLDALRSLPGVTDVGHIWGSDGFILRSDSEVTSSSADAALQRVISFRLLRRLLALLPDLAKPLNGRL